MRSDERSSTRKPPPNLLSRSGSRALACSGIDYVVDTSRERPRAECRRGTFHKVHRGVYRQPQPGRVRCGTDRHLPAGAQRSRPRGAPRALHGLGSSYEVISFFTPCPLARDYRPSASRLITSKSIFNIRLTSRHDGRRVTRYKNNRRDPRDSNMTIKIHPASPARSRMT